MKWVKSCERSTFNINRNRNNLKFALEAQFALEECSVSIKYKEVQQPHKNPSKFYALLWKSSREVIEIVGTLEF